MLQIKILLAQLFKALGLIGFLFFALSVPVLFLLGVELSTIILASTSLWIGSNLFFFTGHNWFINLVKEEREQLEAEKQQLLVLLKVKQILNFH